MILLVSPCAEKMHEREFVEPILRAIPGSKAVHYTKVTKKLLDEADGIIITGTALMDNKYFDHQEEFNWIKDFKKPLLGICAGAQILALAYGTTFITNVELGYRRLISEKDKLDNKEIYALHQYCVTPPKGFEVIASTNVPHQFTKDNITCLMYHPEVTDPDWFQTWAPTSS